MTNPTAKLTQLFARWTRPGWPILAIRPLPLLAERLRKVEQVIAGEIEGAIKPAAATEGPEPGADRSAVAQTAQSRGQRMSP